MFCSHQINIRGESPTSFIGNLRVGRRVGLIQFEFTARAQVPVPSVELAYWSSLIWDRGPKMLLRWGCVAAICFGLAPGAEAAEHSGLIHRASCSVVRFYVAKFSASAAETWARSHGATDAEIEAARRCLKSAPAQAAQAAHWRAQ